MPSSEASERKLAAKKANYVRWSTADPVAGTAAARAAFNSRFELEVDPDNKLDPVERARRAECARKAYFTDLALRSAKARRARKTAA